MRNGDIADGAQHSRHLIDGVDLNADAIDWDAALNRVDLSDAKIALIQAFRSHPDHAATASMLADDLGYRNYRAANRAIGALGKTLGTGIASAFEPPHRPDGTAMWWTLVATGELRDDGLFWWTLRRDLNDALRRHGV